MSAANEVWRPVPGFPSYEVSAKGFVRRALAARGAVAGRALRAYKQPNGYLRVTLSENGIRIKKYVHRIVLEAFCGLPKPECTDCAHGNGDRTDNRLENLRWATRSENVADTDIHGTKARGERNGHAILNAEDVLRMRSLRKEGVSQERLAGMFGVSRWTVSDACSGKNWSWLQ